jgi:hypothetical protein
MPSLSSAFGAEYEQRRQLSAEQTPVSYLQDVGGRSQMRSGLSSHLHASAHEWGQVLTFGIWLTFGDGAKCDKIENNRSFTISSHGVFPYPDVHRSRVCLAFGH